MFFLDKIKLLCYNIIKEGIKINFKEYLKETGFDNLTGENVGIAIIDSGCNIKNDNIKYTYNAYTKTDDVHDHKGHGTNIYSIINEIAPKSNYYIYKGLDDFGNGDMLAIYECLLRIRDKEDIDVVCLSFSSFGELSITTARELKKVLKNKKIMISSLGNDSSMAETYPSHCDGVYSTGGLSKDITKRYETSNYSFDTDFVALGEDIKINNTSVTGTSFANAIVVGQVASLLSLTGKRCREIDKDFFKSYFKETTRNTDTAFGSLYNKEGE